MKKCFCVFLSAMLLAAAPAVVYVYLNRPGEMVQVEIPSGAPGGEVAQILKQNGVIKSSLFFKICLKLSGAAPMLRSGYFALNKNMSAPRAIWRLVNDSGVKLERVSILEGWRMEEIAEELLLHGIIADKTAFIEAAKSAGAEGYLFPSTYLMAQNMQPQEVIDLMLAQYKAKIAPLIAAASPLLSEKEILTIASIVEREALMHDERPKIAAVYLNRVKIGKRLEADPTVQYALGYNHAEQRHWKKGLTYKDLRCDSPYNTYRYAGIPPGPIASPGVHSVAAVLRPEPDFDALYFVADNTGRHVFSKTYDEHVENINRIRGK